MYSLPTLQRLNGNDINEAAVIRQALGILARRARQPGHLLSCNESAADYIRLTFADDPEREHFACLYLDNRHRVIETEVLFHGTIDGASVHPREVVKAALHHNAAACIFAHNHPSGVAEPSRSDIQLTERLKAALALVDVRVLDHIIVGDGEHVSLAQRGLL